jgi:hypothetical protein
VEDATAVVDGIEVCLPLAGLIDFDRRRASGKEIEKGKRSLPRDGQLNNEKFIANAPEDIVDALRTGRPRSRRSGETRKEPRAGEPIPLVIPLWQYESLSGRAAGGRPVRRPVRGGAFREREGRFLARRGVFCAGRWRRRCSAGSTLGRVMFVRRAGAWPRGPPGEASGPLPPSCARNGRLELPAALSGVATATFPFADKIAPYGTRLLDTRKTTPLLRT